MWCDIAAEREDHVGLELHELCGKVGKPFGLSLRKAVFKRDVLAVDVAQLAKAREERLRVRIALRRAVDQNADARTACRLLRICSDRKGY
jgi:hypothetical protein